jgi:hypothetical protein
MQVDARISSAWRRRMLFMLFMIAGIGGWFLSDGYYFWPNEAERYEAYSGIKDSLIEQGKAEDEESSSVRLAWQRYAKEQGYTSQVPKERTAADMGEQRVIGWVLCAGAALFAVWVAWNHTLRVTAEGELVTGSNGKQVELDSIIKIDRKKWKNKGIAYAIYEVDGKLRRLTLDDHKFEGCEAIILEAERRIKARKEESQV